MIYFVIALAAALAVVLWRLHKAGQRLRSERAQRTTFEHNSQRYAVENDALKRRLDEVAEVLKVHRAMQSDAKWHPDLAALLRKYYGH